MNCTTFHLKVKAMINEIWPFEFITLLKQHLQMNLKCTMCLTLMAEHVFIIMKTWLTFVGGVKKNNVRQSVMAEMCEASIDDHMERIKIGLFCLVLFPKLVIMCLDISSPHHFHLAPTFFPQTKTTCLTVKVLQY